MEFQNEMKRLGETSGEHAITEAIVSAYNAIMEGVDVYTPSSTVYVSGDGSQVLGLTWSDNAENIDDEDYDEGYNCYTLGDLYDVQEGFDLSQLPSKPWELEDLEGKGITLSMNLQQQLYKNESIPSAKDVLGVYVNPADGWKPVRRDI